MIYISHGLLCLWSQEVTLLQNLTTRKIFRWRFNEHCLKGNLSVMLSIFILMLNAALKLCTVTFQKIWTKTSSGWKSALNPVNETRTLTMYLYSKWFLGAYFPFSRLFILSGTGSSSFTRTSSLLVSVNCNYSISLPNNGSNLKNPTLAMHLTSKEKVTS